MTGPDLPDEVNPRAKILKLQEEAKKKGLPKVARADPWLEGITKDFKKDSQGQIDFLFLNEKLSKYEYFLLSLLNDIKQALSKKRRSK